VEQKQKQLAPLQVEWAALKKDSKFSRVEGFAGPVAGRILIQDHGDEVWFRAIRIREL
jgi:hypothetical protein